MLFKVFPPVAFNILSLSFIFVSLILSVSVYSSLGLSFLVLCASWTWLTISLFPVREDFGYYFFKYFLRSFLSFPSGLPIMSMLVCLMLSHSSLGMSFFFFFPHPFFYILFCGSDFYHHVLQVIYPFFCLSYSAIDSF